MLLIVAATEHELRGATGLAGVSTLTCGIGPVDAAATVAARLATGTRPSAVLHVGIAGARRARELQVGCLVVGSGSLYCDTSSRLVRRSIMPDDDLLAAAHAALPEAPMLVIGTSADVGGSDDCDVEAMEGFAVLRAAAIAGVPAIEVRSISNEIEQVDRALWRFDDALDALAAALPPLAAAIASLQHAA